METVDIQYNGEILTVAGDYINSSGDNDTPAFEAFTFVDAFVGEECVTFLVEMLDPDEISKIEADCLEEIQSR